ncbi:prepilin-type N-terminal cleavage/methylation domain-containing protein [Myxococcota bacterium]|nr:prepilin-type N-terminal cleavage/methylation domain-containing protein [Myxococcota bacterium]
MRAPLRQSRGFSLLEVLVALSILGITLTALLQVEADSLNAAGRARDITIASLLARSKMIDVERDFFDEGMPSGDSTEEGNFSDEGFKDYKWNYKVSEVELDLSMLTGLCGGMGGGDDDAAEGAAAECEGMFDSFSGPLEALTDSINSDVRLVSLQVTWPEGKYLGHMEIRAIITKDDAPGLGGVLQGGAPGQPGAPGAPATGGRVQPGGMTPKAPMTGGFR